MFQKLALNTFDKSPFALIGEEWTLITAGTEEKCNTMTASWGSLGVLWGSPMATVYIRPQRFTKEFVDREEYFSLSFFSEDYRQKLAFCGKESGKEVDKIEKCGFTMAFDQAPYMQEAHFVLICKKRCCQPLDSSLIPREIKEKWYPEEDYHWVYYGEIVEALRKV
ncbi:MAG: flavin reductase family protein [Eubacteriales bacterium]